MTTHAHLALETPRANLDKFMHGLETAYTVYFNLRNDRVGHLFQGRYGADLVEGDTYLLNREWFAPGMGEGSASGSHPEARSAGRRVVPANWSDITRREDCGDCVQGTRGKGSGTTVLL